MNFIAENQPNIRHSLLFGERKSLKLRSVLMPNATLQKKKSKKYFGK